MVPRAKFTKGEARRDGERREKGEGDMTEGVFTVPGG